MPTGTIDKAFIAANPKLVGEVPAMDLPQEFVQSVMEEAARYSGLPVADHLPNVAKAEPEAFRAAAGNPQIVADNSGDVRCRAVYTALEKMPGTSRREVIIVPVDFDPASTDDHGVLLHEMVHHLQHANGSDTAYDNAKYTIDIVEADARIEIGAYEAQLKFYAEHPGVDASGYENALDNYRGTLLNCLRWRKQGGMEIDANEARTLLDHPHTAMVADSQIVSGSFQRLCDNVNSSSDDAQ